MTSKELISQLARRKPITIENQSATENIAISKKTLVVTHDLAVTFKDCSFLELSLDTKIRAITFQNCKIQLLEILVNHPAEVLTFEQCTIEKLIVRGRSDVLVKSLVIGGILKQFDISGNIDKVHLNYVEQASLNEPDFTVSDSVINGYNIKSLELNSIRGINIRATGRITKIINGNSEDIELTLTNLRDLSSFSAYNCETTVFRFLNSELETVAFFEGDQNTIEIDNLKSGQFTLNGGNYSRLRLHGTASYFLKGTKSDNSNLSVKEFVFYNLTLVEKAIINFERIEWIGAMLLVNFQNNGSLYVNGCEIKDQLTILESKLNNCTFNNINLADECEVDILDVDISETIFNNFRWNRDYILSDKFTEDKYTNYFSFLLALRESYRQLKANYLKNGNKIESLEFQKHELNTHYKILRLNLKKSRSWRNLGNYLIVASNKVFSDFGQNIWKPIVFLISFHILWFNVLLITRFDVYPIIYGYDADATKSAVNGFFITLLPTHGLELTIDSITKPIGGLVDFFMRVFGGYFIFYFVYSSRKYHH